MCLKVTMNYCLRGRKILIRVAITVCYDRGQRVNSTMASPVPANSVVLLEWAAGSLGILTTTPADSLPAPLTPSLYTD